MTSERDLGLDSAVLAYAKSQGVGEVLHFTTHLGLLGIYATGAVRSRDRLESDKYIEHIYTPNCADRLKDAAWTDYVNLSISRVNGRMLGVSENWHSNDGVWWVVLAFDATLLADSEVYFTTTNNTYPCVKRGTGRDGLAELFAPSVQWGYYGSWKHRTSATPDHYATDAQAEVLYPGEVTLDRLQRVYVRDAEHIDYVKSLSMLQAPKVPVEHKPEVFQ